MAWLLSGTVWVVGKGLYVQVNSSKDSLHNFHVLMNAEFSGLPSFLSLTPQKQWSKEKGTNSPVSWDCECNNSLLL